MKKFSTAFVTIFAFLSMMAQEYSLPDVPSRFDTPEKRINYLAVHFWKNFNPRTDSLCEQLMVDFLSVTSASSDCASKKAVRTYTRLVRRNPQLRPDGDLFVDKYLYDRRSPLFNEQLYVRFLKAQGGKRAEFLLEQIYKNRVGSPATDFQYFDKNGVKCRLSDNYNKYEFVLIVFYDKFCENCQRTLAALEDSDEIKNYCEAGLLKVIAVDISVEDKETWLSTEAELPRWCEPAMLGESEFFDEAKYFFEEMPAIYLLDSKGTVILKQAFLPDVIDVLLH